MKNLIHSLLRNTWIALAASLLLIFNSNASAQTEEQIAQAGAVLAAELGLASADQIKPTDDQGFYDALYNVAQANPELAEALAVVVVRGLRLSAVDSGKNVKNVVTTEDPMLQDILGKSAAAIIAGANLVGDAANAVLNAIAAALPPGYQAMMPAITDVAFQSLSLFASGDVLENLRTNPIFNFTAPPGSSTGYEVDQQSKKAVEKAGEPTATPTPDRRRPVSSDQGQVTPAQNI